MQIKTAIYRPNNSLYNQFKNRKDIVFLYPGYYQIIKNGLRRNINYDQVCQSIDSNRCIDISEIRKAINNFSTIWTRWVSKAEKYEIFRESTIILIFNIVKHLNSLDIRNIIFTTSCPHHHDTFCIYTASNLLKLSNIFLTTIIFNGDLLPIIYQGNYAKNKPFGKSLNKRSFNKIIDKFILNLKEKKTPNN